MNFRHTGPVGDLIYSLALVKQYDCSNFYISGDAHPRCKPLVGFIRNQPYIDECEIKGMNWFKTNPCYNLDGFRKILFRRSSNMTIIEAHFSLMNKTFHKKYNNQWLFTEDKFNEKIDIVVHRSFRYIARKDYLMFEFLKKINKQYNVYCIGYDAEAARFKGMGIKHIKTSHIDELIAVINSCKVYIGNQSGPLAIAAGLGKNRLMEECPYLRDCYLNCPNEYKLTVDSAKNISNLEYLLNNTPKRLERHWKPWM